MGIEVEANALISGAVDGPNDKAGKAMRLASRAFSRRTVWETIWDQIFELVIPERFKRMNEIKTPEQLYNRIYDSTAVEAAQQLANMMTSGLVPPWVQWFKIKAGPGLDLRQQQEINQALDVAGVNEKLMLHLNLSNFTQEIQPTFLDGTVGTMCIKVQPKKDGIGVEFKSVPITEIAIDENSHGVVDSVFRKYLIPARDFPEDWKKKVAARDKTVAERWEKNPDEKIEVLETNTPMTNGGNLNMLIYEPQRIILSEREMPRNPYLVARWSGVPGHPYGRGPATITFGDIRALNKMKELMLKNAARVVSGMWAIRGDSTINARNTILRGGTMLTVRSNDNQNPDIRELPQNSNLDVGAFNINDLRASVKSAFLADQFSPTIGTKMTATEIVARSRIIAQNLGATYGRLQNELLIPLVTHLIDILREQDEIPDVIKLDRDQFDVVFLSNLALSQRLQEVDNMIQFIGISSELSQLDPRAGLIIDSNKYQRQVADLLDIKSEVLRSEQEIEEITDQAVQANLALQQQGTADAGQVAPG